MDDARRTPPRPADGFAPAYVHAAAFTAGLLALQVCREVPGLGLLGVLALPALLPWRGRAGWATAVFGLLYGVLCLGSVAGSAWPVSRHNEVLRVSGHLASLAEPIDTADPEDAGWRFRFEPQDPALPPMRVSWYRMPAEAGRLAEGDCWTLTLRVRVPRGSFNPGGFDYEAWLFRQRIGAVASVREGERCAGRSASPWRLARQALIHHLQATLPGHPGLPLLAAITLGDDSGLRAQDWSVFRITGTTHLVAVSGFNVAIVGGIAFLLGRWLWSLWPPLCLRLPAQKAGMLVAALVGLAYALLAGWEAPVQRAAIMLGLLLAAAGLDRLQKPGRVLALAWMLVLLIDPAAVVSPGCWLSFAAVALIFYRTRGRLGREALWRETLGLQVALTLGLLPMGLGWFQGIGGLSLPVNLIAVPVIAVITPVAFAALLLSLLWPGLGDVLLGVVASALAESARGLAWLAGQAGAPLWWAANPPPAALALAGLGVVLLLAPRGLPLRPLGLLCVLPLAAPPQPAPAQGFEVAVLDVGQGLAVVVQTAQHVLLYDTGPAAGEGFDAGESVVVPYLLARGRHRLDALVVSHDDRDHAGGLGAVRRRLDRSAEYGALTDTPCRDGQAWTWDDVRFEMLHPADAGGSDNEGSCVLLVSHGEHRLLLTGDIEKAAEARLLEQHRERLRADLLVAPHHGSRSSSSPAFVDAVQPRVVVYGAAWRSRFGHPRPEVVARYAALGARQYVTGVSGAVLLDVRDGEWQATEWRREHRHWWNGEVAP